MLSEGESRELARIERRLSAAYPGLARQFAGQRTPEWLILVFALGVVAALLGGLFGLALVVFLGVGAVLFALFRLPTAVTQTKQRRDPN
jgi:hypothetical protein